MESTLLLGYFLLLLSALGMVTLIRWLRGLHPLVDIGISLALVALTLYASAAGEIHPLVAWICGFASLQVLISLQPVWQRYLQRRRITKTSREAKRLAKTEGIQR